MADQSSALTVVTVVFEPELALLRLQARSFARFAKPEQIAQFMVLDNCAGGMGGRAERALRRELGADLSAKCVIHRTGELGVDGSVEGWRTQQAAKLLIARRVTTPHYLVLDAKNHLIAPLVIDDLVHDGLARGGTHPYWTHPLRSSLERTLRMLDADEATIERCLADFPRTVTPFVIDTTVARRMLDDIEERSGLPFAEAFEQAGALEFFLYSGWSLLRGEGMPCDGTHLAAPILWPRQANATDAAEVVAEARNSGAVWFAVHRRVLARGDSATRKVIEDFWVDRSLFSQREARDFMTKFRLGFVPAMLKARIARRASALRGR